MTNLMRSECRNLFKIGHEYENGIFSFILFHKTHLNINGVEVWDGNENCQMVLRLRP